MKKMKNTLKRLAPLLLNTAISVRWRSTINPDTITMLNPLLNFGVVAGTQYIGAVLGAILFFFLANWLLDYILRVVRWGEETLVKMPIVDVMFGAMGLISGLIVAFLLFLPISKILDVIKKLSV